MKKRFFAALLFTIHTSLSAEPLPLDSTMSKQEQQEMGVDSMTPQQKQALERWSGNWTKKVLDQSPTYHSSKNLKQWIDSWPLSEQANTAATPKQVAEEQKKLNRIIDKIRDKGAIIELKDGSVWRVSEIDRKKTVTWNRGDKVDWRKSEFASFPPYYMTNLMENNINPSVNQIAGVDMITAPSETGKKKPEPPGYYKDSVAITEIQVKGWDVTLQNNSVWKIAPRDWERVLMWQKGDRVRVEANNDILYPFRLVNLDSGDTALAGKKNQTKY